MPTTTELEAMFADLRMPQAGRNLVRDILANAPVRELQSRNDTVRTRYLSKKMGRAHLAESRTVELPAFVWYDNDKAVSEYYAQPCKLDMLVSGLRSGRTRLQHTPDAFVIRDGRFYLEEWRTEERLERLAEERPHHFTKDADGTWHYLPAEEHCQALGITHRLRSADELPRVFIANMRFLADFALESAPLVPEKPAAELLALVQENKRVPHLELVYKHGFSADHIFAMVLDGRLYVDLQTTRCDQTDTLIIYSSEVVAKADAILCAKQTVATPSCALDLRPGARFVYDGRVFEVALPGLNEVFVRDERGHTVQMPLSTVRELHERSLIATSGEQLTQREYDLQTIVADEAALQEAVRRLEALAAPMAANVSPRTLRRWQAQVAGAEDPALRLQLLMPTRSGNTTKRLPEQAVELAEKTLATHNRAANPTKQSTYQAYVELCTEAGVKPMGKSSFYAWIKQHEDIRKREGKRKAYQKGAIPLTFDYDQPVHGVQPHEVVYCDHTVANIFLKGSRLPDLGKPTLTVMVDGALSMVRSFVLLYRPAGTVAVLLALRDYVRRWGCLPRVLVLDNGREFHSNALKVIASVFDIELRWRRRSKPRDSTLVERALGVAEQEILSCLDGNTIALKNPREVSREVSPEHHIKWTLPALHGSLEHYFFNTHANRIHPRFGMTPLDWEKRLFMEYGTRSHRMVRVDPLFMLLTSPHATGATRKLDRRKGVFVDGLYYWNDRFASSTRRNHLVEVRVELWNASVVYVCFDGQWLVAQARDGRRLEGRFAYELEMQAREEARRQRTVAAADRNTPANAIKKLESLRPELWDDRLREQGVEEYLLFKRLGMVEALPEAANPHAASLDLGTARGSDLELKKSLEPEGTSSGDQISTAAPTPTKPHDLAEPAAEEMNAATADEDYF